MNATLPSLQRRQVFIITVVAVGLYLAFRALPTGTNLNHMDFRMTGANAIEFCDPANPQFIPVVAVRSPVSMAVETQGPARAGAEVQVTVRLATSSGKPLGPEDLLIAHTRKLHLLAVDPTLQDYRHIHPNPTKTPGEWSFSFTPLNGGLYRVFADFTPVATGRGLYAHADLVVAGDEAQPIADAVAHPSASTGAQERVEEGYRYALVGVGEKMRAGAPADLTFTVSREDGQPVNLEPVMDAYAHLVAFDAARGGFAHLHPAESDLTKASDPLRPTLSFKITIPQAGRYVIWAQIAIDGRERFVPFWFDVPKR